MLHFMRYYMLIIKFLPNNQQSRCVNISMKLQTYTLQYANSEIEFRDLRPDVCLLHMSVIMKAAPK